MLLNPQISQLFWRTAKFKLNLIGINQVVYKHTSRSEFKLLKSFYKINVSKNYQRHISSIQNFSLFKSINQTRNFSHSSVIYKKEKLQDKNIKNEDANKTEELNIGDGTWMEVYQGVLTTQLKLLKMFSIGSSIIGLSMQPILYEKVGNADLAVVVTLASFLGFFTFITPALIHWVSKKYVIKLEYDPKRDIYAATTLSFFLREKKIHFKVDEVIRPDIPGMFTSFLVKNQSLFIDPMTFDDLDHYSRIMGLDQPLDFLDKNDKKTDS